MLFELASGNFDYQIPTIPEEGLSQSIVRLNEWGATLKQELQQCGYSGTKNDIQHILQLSVWVNPVGNIISCTDTFASYLNYNTAEIINNPITTLILPTTINEWKDILNEAGQNENYSRGLNILWYTKQQKILPAFSTLTRHANSNNLLIGMITTVNTNNTGSIKNAESKWVNELHRYIVENLHEPLPTAKELAKMFGTNEFKLKEAFRKHFNSGIYHFYNTERLTKAHKLIQNTNLPLKEIPFLCGFSDYANFSKAFKKKYSYSPSDLHRAAE